MTTTFDTHVTATLNCGHLATIHVDTLMAGEPIYCWACSQGIVGDAHRAVVTFQGMRQGHNFRCRKCLYRRSYGVAQLACRVAAVKHSLAKMHTVDIYLDSTLCDTLVRNEPTLPLNGEAPF